MDGRKEGAEGGILVVEFSLYLQSIYSPRQKQRYSGLLKRIQRRGGSAQYSPHTLATKSDRGALYEGIENRVKNSGCAVAVCVGDKKRSD